MINNAYIYKSKSGNWHISFHHPVCRDGTIGKKIHRSLKVNDESEARELQHQMNELLRIAATPSLLPTRSHAVTEKKYARVIIDAFFDCLTPEPIDYLAFREKAMQLPDNKGKDPVPRVLFVGATAAGKSRLIQQLLQTTRENFPMRGAGRTTVADTEVIVEGAEFAAVVTFYSESEVREIIKENVLEACAFVHREKKDRTKIASKLLVDSDKRFRFNFVLGAWECDPEAMEDDNLDDEGQEHSLDIDASGAMPWENLGSCVAQVISIAEVAWEAALRELQPTSQEDELVVEEYWLKYVNQDSLDALAEEILEELERRLCAATNQPSWPATHRIADTADRSEFFRLLQPFYQNDRRLFGSLVTPLVQGIRVRGAFAPPSWVKTGRPTWVLLDGQGVGHEQGGSTKINRTVPPELARKFTGADLICLVDRAVPAMTGDAPILLENLIIRGHLDRLALVFTHFENVMAPDLDLAGRKAKVLEGLSGAIQAITSLPKGQRVLLEGTAESKAYFLSRLDQPEIKSNLTRSELQRLCEHFTRSASPAEVPKFRPLYNEYQIANVLRREIEAYRKDWSAAELSSYHWKVMEALTNWIGHAYSDGYPKRNLYPGQDLSQRLVSAVSNELESPSGWEPYKPGAAEEESRILNAVRSKAGDQVDAYCRNVLVRDPRAGFWLPAYKEISGVGTKVRRARTVARILEDRAQLPDEGLGLFTKDIWRIVENSIAEVYSPAKG